MSPELRLITRAANGDDDAFTRWLESLRPQLLRYARDRLGGDRTEAEDVVQDASMRALVALRGGRVPANPRAWMYVIVRNRCHDVRSGRRAVDPLDEVGDVRSAAPGPDDRVAARRQLDAVVDAIGALPDAQRRALVSATFEGRAYEEIAARESTSVQAVKSLVHRARRGLEASGARAAALMPFGLREQIVGFFTQHTATAASVAAVAVAVPVVPLQAPHSPPPSKTAAKKAPVARAAAVSAPAASAPTAAASPTAAPAPAAAPRADSPRAVAAACSADAPLEGFSRRALIAARGDRSASDAEYGDGCTQRIDAALLDAG